MERPNLFFLEKSIPGVAEAPEPNLLSAWQERVPGTGGWSRIPGSQALPAVYVCGFCDTAFHVASFLCEKGLLSEWDSVVATGQHAGIGQYGRKWISPEGNLYLVWRLPAAFLEKKDYAGLLPLLLGKSIAESFSKLGLYPEIKWPNDLLLNNKKIGGMLIRSSSLQVLAGIGINIAFAPEPFMMREGHSLEAACLKDAGWSGSALSLWTSLLPNALTFLAEALAGEDLSFLVKKIEEKLWRRQERVTVHPTQGESFLALLCGLSRDGGLRLFSERGEGILYSGSISP